MIDFRPGDKVRRRTGTLGNMDGMSTDIGTVLIVDGKMVTVRFASRTERFHWDTYERIEHGQQKAIDAGDR